MADLGTQRREFIRLGVKGLAAFAGGSLLSGGSVVLPSGRLIAQPVAPATVFSGLDSLGPLLPPDENGIMLPAGYRSRVVAITGKTPLPDGDYVWHAEPDGGATYGAADGGWVYVSNSEVPATGGGVGALRFNSRGELVDSYSILSGSSSNCAGGKTPWNTWLSCEEMDRGLVYECDPFGEKFAEVRPALGAFRHEAVAVDTVNDHLYLTEDEPDGCFYRFRPTNALPDLSSGVLEVAQVVDTQGKRSVVWHPVADPLARTTLTRKQVAQATKFEGGEGIGFFETRIYFTTKGDNRVWVYDVNSAEIAVLYDIKTSANPILKGVDNIVITPAGDVIVAEDGGDNQLVALTPSGAVVPLLQVVGQDESELCGPAFDPSYTRLYFSSQNGFSTGGPGITYEITGPFA
jgi:secreted PhoX family phosphatase